MKLYGSTTSPFVRRIRLYLGDKPYEFVNLDIFSEEGRASLTTKNPAQKIPALLDGTTYIYDSRVIYRYLSSKYDDKPITWAEENLLTLIDAVNDSLVSLLINERSGFDTKQDALFFNLQHERVESVLAVLNEDVYKGGFTAWSYPSICLYCLLDWIEFRQLHAWNKFNHLKDFYQYIQENELLKKTILATDPR